MSAVRAWREMNTVLTLSLFLFVLSATLALSAWLNLLETQTEVCALVVPEESGWQCGTVCVGDDSADPK